MIEIDLRDHFLQTDQFYVILENNEGYVEIINQTRGHWCLKQTIKGILLPILTVNDDCRIKEKLYEHIELSEEHADYIDKYFEDYDIPLRINRNKIKDSGEAWIFVEFIEQKHGYNYFGFKTSKGDFGILTWNNSD